jgi:hypothetical protein
MKSQLAHQLFKIHDTTRSIVEFEYIDNSHVTDGGMNYQWLLTHLLKNRSTRGSQKVLWSITKSECSFTIIKE